MADSEDIQPLVCDNGTGMVKVICSRVISAKHCICCDRNDGSQLSILFPLQKLNECCGFCRV